MANVKRAIKSQRKKKPMPTTQTESPLVKRAKKFFSEPEPATVFVRDLYPTFMDEPQIVQSYTTYSLGEVPLLSPSQE
jgi:hypothetical protein